MPLTTFRNLSTMKNKTKLVPYLALRPENKTNFYYNLSTRRHRKAFEQYLGVHFKHIWAHNDRRERRELVQALYAEYGPKFCLDEGCLTLVSGFIMKVRARPTVEPDDRNWVVSYGWTHPGLDEQGRPGDYTPA